MGGGDAGGRGCHGRREDTCGVRGLARAQNLAADELLFPILVANALETKESVSRRGQVTNLVRFKRAKHKLPRVNDNKSPAVSKPCLMRAAETGERANYR